MAVLDIHTHLFPPEIIAARVALLSKERGFSILYANPESRMVDLSGLQRYLDEEHIQKAVALVFPFEDNGLVSLCNDYIIQASKIDERIIPFIMIDRRNKRAALTEAERCFALGACGIGELAYYDTGFSDAEGKGLKDIGHFLEEKKAPLLLHVNEQVGHDYAGKSKIDFTSIVHFVEHHPELRLILAHMGGGICFYEFMPKLRHAFSNVYYDCAASPFLYSHDIYAFAARYLGSKILFGSDYPLLPLKRYMPFFKDLNEDDRNSLLYGNGTALLGL
jgi:uncharacterized protein